MPNEREKQNKPTTTVHQLSLGEKMHRITSFLLGFFLLLSYNLAHANNYDYDTINIIAYNKDVQVFFNEIGNSSVGVNLNKQSKLGLQYKEKIAKVVWCEDRTSEKGMLAVLSVIYNRAVNKTLEGLYKEIAKPGQFGCFHINKKIPSKGLDNERYLMAISMVEKVHSGEFKPIISATYFYNVKEKQPRWAKTKRLVCVIGQHKFFV